MVWLTTVATLIAVAIALYLVIRWFLQHQALGTPMTVTIQGPIHDGREPKTFSGEIPVSDNEKKGLVFSYAAWVVVHDWMYRNGELRCIFNKGSADGSVRCPGVYLDGTSNSMIIHVDTYGQPEMIQIPNLPAEKWFHVALVVDQTSVDVYINGILRVHQTLAQLPRQNRGPVYIATEGGWSGQIGTLTYHRYALSESEISSMTSTPPYEDSTRTKVALPPYFDSTWYVGRY